MNKKMLMIPVLIWFQRRKVM